MNHARHVSAGTVDHDAGVLLQARRLSCSQHLFDACQRSPPVVAATGLTAADGIRTRENFVDPCRGEFGRRGFRVVHVTKTQHQITSQSGAFRRRKRQHLFSQLFKFQHVNCPPIDRPVSSSVPTNQLCPQLDFQVNSLRMSTPGAVDSIAAGVKS